MTRKGNKKGALHNNNYFYHEGRLVVKILSLCEVSITLFCNDPWDDKRKWRRLMIRHPSLRLRAPTFGSVGVS